MTTLQESRFSYLTNPQRIAYTSDIINNAERNYPRIHPAKYNTQEPRIYHRAPYFTSPVKNSHQYPMITTNFIKPYTQPMVYSQLYKAIDNSPFEIDGRVIKRKDLITPPLHFE